MKKEITILKTLTKKAGFQEDVVVTPMPSSGSSRRYYRIMLASGKTLIGSCNPEVKENRAQIHFTKHFRSLGFKVPAILAKSNDDTCLLLEDLGDETLLSILQKEGLSERVKNLYRQSLHDLVRFQTEGVRGLDLSYAFPAKAFDRRSIMWDLNYFKYYFLKPHTVDWDETLLEDAFENLTAILLESDAHFFMYRDFQARNIMICRSEPHYIDFQGGRKGPLPYDVVSLLYQAKAALPEGFRTELLNHYLAELERKLPGKRAPFIESYPFFIYFRLMQVLGAYGFRGLMQRKAHFLQSIPYALNNLGQCLKKHPLPEKLQVLTDLFEHLAAMDNYDFQPSDTEMMTVSIHSFSYKKGGVPDDYSGNGGGFVFDCRALPNPGRIAGLKEFTGLQMPVINYLEEKEEVKIFLNRVFGLITQSVDNYLERKFNHLTVSFGCTGGKHRSVFSAEKLRSFLSARYGTKIKVRLRHLQLEQENSL